MNTSKTYEDMMKYSLGVSKVIHYMLSTKLQDIPGVTTLKEMDGTLNWYYYKHYIGYVDDNNFFDSMLGSESISYSYKKNHIKRVPHKMEGREKWFVIPEGSLTEEQYFQNSLLYTDDVLDMLSLAQVIRTKCKEQYSYQYCNYRFLLHKELLEAIEEYEECLSNLLKKC